MSYKLKGYTTPQGVDSREKVREWQSYLGVKTDGIWGPKTQAAYEQAQRSQTPAQDALLNYNTVWNIPPDVLSAANSERAASSPMRAYMSAISDINASYGASVDAAFGAGGSAGDSGDTLFNEYFNTIMASFAIPYVAVSTPSQGQLRSEAEAYLRPAKEGAIQDVMERAEENKAELEADANARGMGASTFVSSMKQREGARAEKNAKGIETSYLATLAKTISDNMQYYTRLKADADMTNAQMYASAQSQAMSLAGAWYSSYMQAQYEQAQAAYSSGLSGLGDFMAAWGASGGGASGASGGGSGNSNGSGGGGKTQPAKSTLTASEGKRLLGYLDGDELAQLFNSGASKWRELRRDITLAVGDGVMSDYRAKARDSVAQKPGGGSGGSGGASVRRKTR